jgi:DNA polymerase zeta
MKRKLEMGHTEGETTEAEEAIGKNSVASPEEKRRKLEGLKSSTNVDNAQAVPNKVESHTEDPAKDAEDLFNRNQHLTSISIEIITRTRGTLLPDPRFDPIVAIGYAICSDDIIEAKRSPGMVNDFPASLVTGVLYVDEEAPQQQKDGRAIHRAPVMDECVMDTDSPVRRRLGMGKRFLVSTVPDEESLLWAFVALVRDWDADILTGYEIQKESIGFILDRSNILGLPIANQLSRTPFAGVDRRQGMDEYGEKHDSGIWIVGRMTLNCWRIMRTELKLGIYTLESVVSSVLGHRVPHFAQHVLSAWWSGPKATARLAVDPYLADLTSTNDANTDTLAPTARRNLSRAGTRWRAIDYIATRAALSLHLLDKLDLIGRTSEMARLFGIDFFSVLSRGSQYRVEAVLLRVSKPLDLVAPTASRFQVTRQAAMEVLPLIMEPQSRIYTSPVIVLDFQSLYPSVVIAYNMCYSTILGRLSATADEMNPKIGFAEHNLPPGVLDEAFTHAWEGVGIRRFDPGPEVRVTENSRPRRPQSAYISPNGVVFAPWTNRRGILPRMLQEILDTRIMIKSTMKRPDVKRDPLLSRVLHARQFALKMIANVTYGYAAAGYSGRMPCAEIADAIVQTARTTLERAIKLVESHPTWRAKVVYGDTDSLFVQVDGRSVEEAFRIGEEIAEQVTNRNPRPMQLKLEKVYHPCVLVAKKRYAGFMYESAKQKNPVLDCKGLEMVRRDTCGLVTKLMEASLKTMFSTLDLSQVKLQLQRAWTSMFEEEAPVQDYVFAKEVRLGTYSERGLLPPAAIVASKAMLSDPRAEPRYAERIPYVVINGEPGSRLVDLVLSPHQLLRSAGTLRLNANYYITKQIVPSLERIFSLVGADVTAWYVEMHKPASLRRNRLPAIPVRLYARERFPSWNHAASLVTGNASRLTVKKGESGSTLPICVSQSEENTNAVGSSGVSPDEEDLEDVNRSETASRSAAPVVRGGHVESNRALHGIRTIDEYYASARCDVCSTQCRGTICDACKQDTQRSGLVLIQRHGKLTDKYYETLEICMTCTGIRDPTSSGASACDSLDCPVFFKRVKDGQEVARLTELLGNLGLLP